MRMCACGRELHYSDDLHRRAIEKLVLELGEDVPVTTPEGTWMVPRHYIALHGITGSGLPSHRLGFRQVFRCPRCERVSHDPEDLRHGYCGACHDVTADPVP